MEVEKILQINEEDKGCRQGVDLSFIREATLGIDTNKDCYSWGVEELDDRYGLITPGTSQIFSGRHASGKTTFINNVAWENAKKGRKVLLMPLEMKAFGIFLQKSVDHYNEHVKGLADKTLPILSYKDPIEGRLNLPEFSGARSVYENKLEQVYEGCPKDLVIHDSIERSYDEEENYLGGVESLKQQLLELCAKHDPGLIVIDHLHSLRPDDNEDYVFYTNLSQMLEQFAKEFQVSILGVCQLNKDGQDKAKEVNSSMFKGTAAWTQDAYKAAIITKVAAPRVTTQAVANQFVSAYNRANGTCLKVEGAKGEDGEKPVSIDRINIYLKEKFEEEFGEYRELYFTKARFAHEGVSLLKAHKGVFEFVKHGKMFVRLDDEKILRNYKNMKTFVTPLEEDITFN